MRFNYWRLVEKNLHVFRSPGVSPRKLDEITRLFANLLLDLFLTRRVSPEVAETLTQATLERAILLLPASPKNAVGWLQGWCQQLADRIHWNWNQRGMSADPSQDDLMADPEVEELMPSGEAAVGVAIGFLTERDRLLIRWFYFDRIPPFEIARRMELSETQARQECVRARNRLLDLLEADREIPLSVHHFFSDTVVRDDRGTDWIQSLPAQPDQANRQD